MTIFRRLVIFCLAVGCAASAAAADAPALYSFSDLYRMTVNGSPAEPIIAPLNSEAHPVRVVSEQAAPVSEIRFTVTPVPGPGRWMLLLAGLAAAAWVAHRRLTRPL